MGIDESAGTAAPGCRRCLPCRWGGRARGGWAARHSAPTYEILSSHSRQFQSQCSNSSRRGCNSRCANGCCCRRPKLGSTEPYFSFFLVPKQSLLPLQSPASLCPSCAAADASSGCFYCSAEMGAAAAADCTAAAAKSLLRAPSCSSQCSSSFHDGDSEIAPSAGCAPVAAAASSAAASSATAVNELEPLAEGLLEYVKRSSNLRNLFPCAACYMCSNGNSISMRVLQLPTANGSIIPSLYLHHPAAKQTLLVSHSGSSDLGATYGLLLLLCRVLYINVMGYEYTGYGFCCCRGQKKQQHHQQQMCRPSATGVYADLRAAFLWLLQHQQQTPQSIILYSEDRGLLPSLRLRGELAAEGLQLGGLVVACPKASAGTGAAFTSEIEVAEPRRKKGLLDWILPSCCKKRSELHDVYMQLLQLHEDELLILDRASAAPQGGRVEETPQLVLRQRAAVSATMPASNAACCTCSSLPKGENLRRLKEYVDRARQHQQQQELELQQHQRLLLQQQQAWRGLLEKERALARKQQPKCRVQQPQQESPPCASDGEAATASQVQADSGSPSPGLEKTQKTQQNLQATQQQALQGCAALRPSS